MFANNCLVASERTAAPGPRVRRSIRPAELAHWHRAYIGGAIDVAAKLLVLGLVLSFTARAMTHEGHHGLDRDKGHAIRADHLTQPQN
jgi:hypothetical protein